MASNATTIYIDSKNKAIHYYAMPDGGRSHIIHEVRNFQTRAFDTDFYKAYIEAIQSFARKYPTAQSANTTIVLPDNVVFTDTMTFPTMRGKAEKDALTTSLNGLYKNLKELKIVQHRTVSNKQYNVCCISGVYAEILASLKASGNAGKLTAQNVTFASASTATAIAALEPKLKAATYLLMDLKENYTRVCYVFKGRTVGFTSLPFGYGMLQRDKLAAEDMLFDHSTAELAVLNAKEKAKSKALTVMEGEATDAVTAAENTNGQASASGDEEQSFSNLDATAVNRNTETVIKTLPKKMPRKLPKFMQRPAPETDEELAYENFRIFEKWALCFLQGNDAYTSMGKTDAIYVNMPQQLRFLLDMANREEKENGIKFLPLGLEKEGKDISGNLEMYGGLFVRKVGTSILF